MCEQAFSSAWPLPAMGRFPFTSTAVSWETRQPHSWLKLSLVSPANAALRSRHPEEERPPGAFLQPRVQRAGRADVITEER